MPDYYSINWREYHQKTFHIDPAPFLSPFADRLPPGAHLLDIGCGSGRDLLWLKQRGFEVTGVERSAGLAALARQHAGCTVIEGDFETFDFTTLRADALLLSGSLVHVPHDRLPGVLANVLKALKNAPESASGRTPAPFPSGQVYISLKEGTGCRTDAENRTFYLWQDNELRALFDRLGLSVRWFSRNPSAVGSGEMWLGYVLSVV